MGAAVASSQAVRSKARPAQGKRTDSETEEPECVYTWRAEGEGLEEGKEAKVGDIWLTTWGHEYCMNGGFGWYRRTKRVGRREDERMEL
jgi:hypothetical protein